MNQAFRTYPKARAGKHRESEVTEDDCSRRTVARAYTCPVCLEKLAALHYPWSN